MRQEAVQQARRAYDRAAQGLQRLRDAQNFEAFEEAWSDFLQASSRVYDKLQAGTTRPRSYAWFGAKLKERKQDPLLRYIHHARNVDQHGLTATTERKAGRFSLKGDAHIHRLTSDGRKVVLDYSPLPGNYRPPKIELAPAHVGLARVRDRGDWYEVPDAHLDQRLLEPRPIQVAELALNYLGRMLAEAETYA